MKARNVVWCPHDLLTHGQTVAAALGWPLTVDAPVGDADTVFVVGLYDIPDYEMTCAATARARRKILHWCGSDVQYLSKPEMLPEAIHTCESDNLREELLVKGIKAKVLKIPSKIHPEVTPLPDEQTVAFYAGGNAEKYGVGIVRYLMDVFPDVSFLIYKLGEFSPSDMEKVIAATRVHVRFTDHDGSAKSACEFMEAGRRVVTTVDIPYAKRVSKADPVGIVTALRKALAYDEPDTVAAAYYKRLNSVDRFLADFEAVVA